MNQMPKHAISGLDADGNPVYREVVVVVNPDGTPISGGGGGGSINTSGLATETNQLLMLDSVVRESARSQNVAVQASEGVASVRVTSYTLMDQFKSIDSQSGFNVGDIVLRFTTYNTFSNPHLLPKYWAIRGLVRWVRIFDSISNIDVNELLSNGMNTDFAISEVSDVVNETVFERTLQRRALDANLVESFQNATETRTVQASHTYPYPSIYDSGWI